MPAGSEELEPTEPGPAMQGAFGRLSDVAGRRATGWETLAELVDTPTQDLVDALRSREIFGAISRAVGWMDSGREPFLGHVARLDEVAQRADRGDLLSELQAEHDRLFGSGDLRVPIDEMRALAELCRAEQTAWEVDDSEGAKALRVQEHARAGAVLAEVAGIRERVSATTRDDLYRAAAGLLWEFANAEAGVGYGSTVLTGVFPDGHG